jgi:hypothetical protein
MLDFWERFKDFFLEILLTVAENLFLENIFGNLESTLYETFS